MVLAPIVALEFLGGKARPRPTGLEAKGDRDPAAGMLARRRRSWVAER